MSLFDLPGRKTWARWFVWSVWAVLLAAALSFTARYGSGMPLLDEWEFVPVLTGVQPLSAHWLWAQHNEHRIPLPRLLYVEEARLTAASFPLGPLVNVLVLGALAGALIVTAGRLRGWPEWSDAFFPLLLLHWGHHECLLMALLIQFIASTALACTVLLLAVRRAELSVRSAVLAGLCLLCLPLFGQNGVAYVPALALWLGYAGVCRWRSGLGQSRRDGLLMIALAVAAVAFVGVYYFDYQRPANHPASPGLGASLRTALQFLGMSLGLSGIRYWPTGALCVLAVSLASGGMLARVWITRPAERVRAAGLILFLASVAAMALGVGWGRAGLGENAGFGSRYVTLAAPLLCCVYLAWGLYGSPVALRCVQMGLCLVMALFVRYDLRYGAHEAGRVRAHVDQLIKEVRAGLPSRTVAARHCPALYPNLSVLAERLEMLREAGMGPFRGRSAVRPPEACWRPANGPSAGPR